VELRGKKVLVIGAGKSGLAAARFLVGRGAQTTLTDIKEAGVFGDGPADLEAVGVRLCFGRHPDVTKDKYHLLVVSPGVPQTVAPVAAAYAGGIPVIGELELAYRFAASPVVAITGTNGKTTTTALTGEIFRNAGYTTLVAGNIGTPLVAEVEKYSDVIVAEVSSFQLETTVCFRPRIGVVLNITPDHLDRHGNMNCYIEAKARIFANQGVNDYAVLNYDEPVTAALAAGYRGRVIFFSRKHILEKGVFVQDGRVVVEMGSGLEEICGADEVAIPGAHNLENALAAVAAARAWGIDGRYIAGALRNFKGVPHRLEFVSEIKGVKYVNDSKGTNPDASIKALDAYREPVILIAGGKNKGSDFGAFADKIKEKVRVLVVLGQSAGLIAEAARSRGFQNILPAVNLEEAVLLAHRAARPGEIVLLSPACASWDMFNSYEERGDLFKELVLKTLPGCSCC